MAQTARVAGLRFLPPLVLHGAHRVSDETMREHATLFADHLSRYPAWPELEALPPEAGCEVPADDRPPPQAMTAADALPHAAATLSHGWLLQRLVYLGAAVLAGPAGRPGRHHRLPGRRHPDRPLGPGPGDRCPGHAALRRVRRGADALPGRAGTGAAPALGPAPAHLRLGQRAAAGLGRADDWCGGAGRCGLAPGPGRRPGPAAGPVLHRRGHAYRLLGGAAPAFHRAAAGGGRAGSQGPGAVGHGPAHTHPAGRAAGLHRAAGPGWRVRLRGLPGGPAARRDRRPQPPRC